METEGAQLNRDKSRDNNGQQQQQQQQQQPQPSTTTTAMDLLCQSEDQYVAKLRELARQQQQDMLLKQQQQQQMANSSNGSSGHHHNSGNSQQQQSSSSSSSPSPSASASASLANLPLPLLAHAAASLPGAGAANSISSPFLPGAANLAAVAAAVAAAAASASSPSNGNSASFSPNANNNISNISNISNNSSIHNSSSSSSGSSGGGGGGGGSSLRHFKKKALTMQASPSPSPPPPPPIPSVSAEMPSATVTTSLPQSEVKLKLVPYDDDEDTASDKALPTNGSDTSNQLETTAAITAETTLPVKPGSTKNGQQAKETDDVAKKANKVDKKVKESEGDAEDMSAGPKSASTKKRPAEAEEEENAEGSSNKKKLSEPLSVSTAASPSKTPTKTSSSSSAKATLSDTEPLQELKVLLLSPTLPSRSKSSPAAVEQAVEKASPPLTKKMKKAAEISSHHHHHQQLETSLADLDASLAEEEEGACSEVSAATSASANSSSNQEITGGGNDGNTSQETAVSDVSGKSVTDTDEELSNSVVTGSGGKRKSTRARGRNHSSVSATSEGTPGLSGAQLSNTSDVEMKDSFVGGEHSSLLAAISAAVSAAAAAANQSASTTSDSFDFLRPSGTVSASGSAGSQHHFGSAAHFSSSTPNSSSSSSSRGRRGQNSTHQNQLNHLSLLQGSSLFSPISGNNANNNGGGGNGNNSSSASSSPLSSSSSFSNLPEMPTMVTHVGRKPLNGPPCSLKTLVDDGILDPLEGSLTYEILGSKFTGDLLPNGFIRMAASVSVSASASSAGQVFANPSSWANYCRSTIPNAIKEGKNYGSAWSIIRYLGKRLDSYKLRWYRKQKKSFGSGGGGGGGGSGSTSPSASPSPHSSAAASTSGLNQAQLMQLMAAGVGGTGTGAGGGLGNFHPHHPHPHHPHHSNSRRSATATSAEQLSYTAQLLGLPMGGAGHHGHHQSHHPHGGGGGGGSKNIYSYMNRERLYKLDKISLGDTELNGENINDPNEVVNFASIDLNSRDCLQKQDLKVEAVPFAVTGGLQPFLVTVMTNVLMLVDFHAHVVPNEVAGFLGGTWDPRTQHMTITSAYPLMYASCTAKVKSSTTTTADTAEQAKLRAEAVGRIKATMRERNTVLVGWYHSHVRSSPHPTVLDVKRQLRYQKEFLVSPNSSSPVKGGKGGSSGGLAASDYSPVVGLIVSPYYPRTARLVSLMQMFWVAPIYVSAVKDFGRPMQFHYTVTRDAFLTQDLLVEMRAVATHYFKKGDFVPFREKYRDGVTFWEKLHESMKPKLPRDLIEYVSNEELANEICAQALVHFWTFVRSLLTLDKNPEENSAGSGESGGDKKSPEKKTEKSAGGKTGSEKEKEKAKETDSTKATEKSAKSEKEKAVVEATAAIAT